VIEQAGAKRAGSIWWSRFSRFSADAVRSSN